MLNYKMQLLPVIGQGGVVSRWPGSLGCFPLSWMGHTGPAPAAPLEEAPEEHQQRREGFKNGC